MFGRLPGSTKSGLLKIQSTKAELNIIFTGRGLDSESDVQLAAASKAVIVGFHTQIESHAEAMMKEVGIQARLHDIIYHAVDDVKGVLAGLLDKIPLETEKGVAEVKATFKSSHRNDHCRLHSHGRQHHSRNNNSGFATLPSVTMHPAMMPTCEDLNVALTSAALLCLHRDLIQQPGHERL